jgi:hypothetical protein
VAGRSLGNGPKIKKRPVTFRVAGRPNSPPPELLNRRICSLCLHVNPTLVPPAGTKWLSFLAFQ